MSRIEVLRPADVSMRRARKPPTSVGGPKPKSYILIERLGGWRPNKWGLSVREVQILELYCEGLSCGAIGRKVGLSEKTVSTYGRRIRDKMECTHLIHAILLWDREYWVRPEPITPEEVLYYMLGREPNQTEREINLRNWQEQPKVYLSLEKVAREKREAAREAKAPQA